MTVKRGLGLKLGDSECDGREAVRVRVSGAVMLREGAVVGETVRGRETVTMLVWDGVNVGVKDGVKICEAVEIRKDKKALLRGQWAGGKGALTDSQKSGCC